MSFESIKSITSSSVNSSGLVLRISLHRSKFLGSLKASVMVELLVCVCLLLLKLSLFLLLLSSNGKSLRHLIPLLLYLYMEISDQESELEQSCSGPPLLLLFFFMEDLDWLVASLESDYDTIAVESGSEFTYLGMVLTRLDNGDISTHMDGYIDKLLVEYSKERKLRESKMPSSDKFVNIDNAEGPA